MPWTNYHSHTNYCDGTNEPEDYLKSAIAQGVAIYGFSTHSPVPFKSAWSIADDEVPDYIDEVNALKDRYADSIEVYLGMEVDYIPDLTGLNELFIKELVLDYSVGSIHFIEAFEDGTPWEIDGTQLMFDKGLQEIFNGDIEAAIKRYYSLTRQMLEETTPDVIGHLDKIKMHNTKRTYFDESATWYRNAVIETLEVIANKGAVLEVNTRAIYKKAASDFYPSQWILKEAFAKEIPVQINSDSHHPREITANFQEAAEAVLHAGYRSVKVLHQGKWQDKTLTANGIIL